MIRTASAQDAAAITAFWNPVIRDTAITFTPLEKTPAAVAALIAEREAFLVAAERGVVLGFASYAQFRAGPGYAHSQEHTIILAPEARGRGVGRALMTALEARARAAGHHALIGGVSGSNPEGVAFHAAVGFREVGRLPEVGWKLGRWHDLVLMLKIL